MGTSRITLNLSRIFRDESGSILVQFILILVVFFGVAGLVLDSSRLLMVNNDLQQLADAAALAAASKLDGTTALSVAESEARALSNSPSPHLWNTAGDEISNVSFYPTLADADAETNATTAPGSAKFVKVKTGSWGIAPFLLQFAGATSEVTTTASAVAGSSYVACKVQPLMLCNPNEPNTFTANTGDLFGFTVTGHNTFGPGDFALLDPVNTTHSSAAQIRNLLSQSNPNFCYVDTVSPAQGQKTVDVASGINARFDISPTGGGGPNLVGLDQTPGPSNLKGVDNNSCLNSNQYSLNNNKIDVTHALPLNAGMTVSASNPVVGGTFNTADATNYMAAHHGGAAWPSGSASWGATRFELYKKEADTTDAFHSLSGTSSENLVHTPNTCTGTAASTDPERRLVTVAIVDCLSQGLAGNSTKVLFSTQYAQFFLVRPVTNGAGGTDGVIFAEFYKFLAPGDPNGPHHLVQLYR